MPTVYQTFKKSTDPETGRRVRALDKSGQPIPHDKWKFQYTDWTGKRKTGTGTKKEKETYRIACKIEQEHSEIRRGLRPAPTSAVKHGRREFSKVIEEYLAWGASQGGRGGRPWAKTHERKKKAQLNWWIATLGFQTLGEVEGCLPDVEKSLQGLQEKGRVGKTLNAYRETINSFFAWCLSPRNYLRSNPLEGTKGFDTTPEEIKRALTQEDISKLLAVAVWHRALVYEVALCTGLRASELRHLDVADLDTGRGGLHLDASWTKSRKAGFQPAPRDLVKRLAEHAGHAKDLYARWYLRKDSDGSELPENPLLYVPLNTARAFDSDREEAGILKRNPQGVVVFHSFRVTFDNMVLDAGGSAKETQDLMRHASVSMTLNTYGRSREERLAQLAETVGEMVKPKQKCRTYAERKAAGAEGLDLSTVCAEEVALSIPPASTMSTNAATGQKLSGGGLSLDDTRQNIGLDESGIVNDRTNQVGHGSTIGQRECRTSAEQCRTSAEQEGLQKLAETLAQVKTKKARKQLETLISTWSKLPAALRNGIAAMVESSGGSK